MVNLLIITCVPVILLNAELVKRHGYSIVPTVKKDL
jgi:hypothetical protein